MEFLYAINQSLFLFINADHDDHPGAIVMALLIAEYLTAITLVAVAVYLETSASASCLVECAVQPAVGHGGNLSDP